MKNKIKNREVLQVKKKLKEFKSRLKDLKDAGFNPLPKVLDEINILEGDLQKSSIFYRLWNSKKIIVFIIFCIVGIYFIGGNIFSSIFLNENISIVEISNLKNGDYVKDNFMIAGSANNPNGVISNVHIRIDNDSWVIANGTTNWTYEWNTTQVSDGVHTISTRIFNGNVYSEEETILVIVQNTPALENKKPLIEISYPNEGTNISGSIKIIGNASDEDGDIQKVEIRIDGGSWDIAEGKTTWQYIWNTTSVTNGNHMISARSYDGQEYSMVTELSINVYNPSNIIPIFTDNFQDGTLNKWNIIQGIWDIESEGYNYVAHSPMSIGLVRRLVSKITIPDNVIITTKAKGNNILLETAEIAVGFYANENGSCYFINLGADGDALHIDRWEVGNQTNEKLDVNDNVLSENDIWYNVKIMLENNNIYAKRWEVGDTEPANWQVFYYGASPFGHHLLLGGMPGSLVEEFWFDNIAVESIKSDDSIDYTFNPTDDALVKIDGPDINYASSDLQVRNKYGKDGSSGFNWDSLIKFNVSSIPSGTSILSANLRIYFYVHYTERNPAGRDLNLYRATSEWEEKIVTWNTQPSYTSQPTTYSSVPTSFRWMTWDVTGDIQDFVDGVKTNHGWKITDENYFGEHGIPEAVFYSKEYENTNYWPKLEINIGSEPIN